MTSTDHPGFTFYENPKLCAHAGLHACRRCYRATDRFFDQRYREHADGKSGRRRGPKAIEQERLTAPDPDPDELDEIEV